MLFGAATSLNCLHLRSNFLGPWLPARVLAAKNTMGRAWNHANDLLATLGS